MFLSFRDFWFFQIFKVKRVENSLHFYLFILRCAKVELQPLFSLVLFSFYLHLFSRFNTQLTLKRIISTYIAFQRLPSFILVKNIKQTLNALIFPLIWWNTLKNIFGMFTSKSTIGWHIRFPWFFLIWRNTLKLVKIILFLIILLLSHLMLHIQLWNRVMNHLLSWNSLTPFFYLLDFVEVIKINFILPFVHIYNISDNLNYIIIIQNILNKFQYHQSLNFKQWNLKGYISQQLFQISFSIVF